MYDKEDGRVENEGNDQKGQSRNRFVQWTAVVGAFGAALGVLSRNLALGIALGVLFGVVVSMLLERGK
jgi:hypothetical protein